MNTSTWPPPRERPKYRWLVIFLDKDGDLSGQYVVAYTAGIAELLVEGHVLQVIKAQDN